MCAQALVYVIERALGELCLAVLTLVARTRHSVAIVAVQLDALMRLRHAEEDSERISAFCGIEA